MLCDWIRILQNYIWEQHSYEMMARKIWNIVLLSIFSSFIVCGHVYKDYTNNAVLLSSVYDAMKNNLQENIRNNLNRYDVLSDMRNKRK